jgi:hypothetical protein
VVDFYLRNITDATNHALMISPVGPDRGREFERFFAEYERHRRASGSKSPAGAAELPGSARPTSQCLTTDFSFRCLYVLALPRIEAKYVLDSNERTCWGRSTRSHPFLI